ncbi:MAG: hypothetical protein KJP22_09795 [Acidimicrobiia bacterium]|nr:hypothetical protein [Acidimicrobiia bacterium]MBT8193681.1 hypothetical protein [Acidimicrobiia bacterium]NNF88993.1 hypothetical protein [Acidimicrobiia bacterium]NNJ47948.1 hypothetical protein [Acidimicrobiia bacterium]
MDNTKGATRNPLPAAPYPLPAIGHRPPPPAPGRRAGSQFVTPWRFGL